MEVPITSVSGHTATLAIPSVRNTYRSRTQDGSRTAAAGDANGDLFDSGAWGTEDPGDQSKILDMTISDIPFETYDVILYLGHHPFAGGERTGVLTFNGTPMEIGVIEGAFDGTFTQIVNSGDTGNFIVFETVKGPSLSLQLSGYGTNHTGICGFQFREATPQLASNIAPLEEATDIPRDGVLLSWEPGEYAAQHDVYLGTDFDDVNDATTASAVYLDRVTETTYALDRLAFNTTYYWRIDEVNAPPDSTVFKGKVWSFTTEPISYPIDATNITVTASSAIPTNPPERTIDGSGLDANDLHSTGPEAMWLSDMTGPQPTWIEYEFDKAYKLHEMWVWNQNTLMESAIGFGIKDATIEYSADGTDWATLGTTHEFARGVGAPNYTPNTTVDFEGAAAKYVKLTANSNWGGIMTQYGLSEVRFFNIPVLASKPNPASDAQDVDLDSILTWRPGREAAEHDVYMSTDEQAVIDGTAPVDTVPQSSYVPALELGNTYYWRIDEVNEAETPAVWPGELWNFSTLEFFVVDDFEAYNDLPADEEGSNLIYEAWIDGYDNPSNGSTVGYTIAFESSIESVIVHGGKQAMPLFYSNTGGATYSEAERTFAAPQDWTQAGIQTFVLYLRTNSLSEALDTTSSLTTEGDKRWLSQATTSYYDEDAAQSGAISGNQQSSMQTTISGTGTVSFYWKVSSEADWDFLEFYIDGEMQDQISGDVDWQPMTYTITTSGSHILEWRYSKDGAVNNGEDCGWVDKLEWDGGGLPSVNPESIGQLYVKVNGVKVTYPGDVTSIPWRKWAIDLPSLGVNLQAITTLAIGIDGAGASGTLYLDDFRLESGQ